MERPPPAPPTSLSLARGELRALERKIADAPALRHPPWIGMSPLASRFLFASSPAETVSIMRDARAASGAAVAAAGTIDEDSRQRFEEEEERKMPQLKIRRGATGMVFIEAAAEPDPDDGGGGGGAGQHQLQQQPRPPSPPSPQRPPSPSAAPPQLASPPTRGGGSASARVAPVDGDPFPAPTSAPASAGEASSAAAVFMTEPVATPASSGGGALSATAAAAALRPSSSSPREIGGASAAPLGEPPPAPSSLGGSAPPAGKAGGLDLYFLVENTKGPTAAAVSAGAASPRPASAQRPASARAQIPLAKAPKHHKFITALSEYTENLSQRVDATRARLLAGMEELLAIKPANSPHQL